MRNKTEKNPGILHAADIIDLCKPLQFLNISYFSHVFVSNDNKFAGLSNNPAFSEHYLQNEYYNADIHMAQKGIFKDFVIWDAIERRGQSLKMHQEAAAFGVKHTFTIIEKDNTGNHYYHFANDSENKSINQTYITNIDILKKFITYFNDQVKQSPALSSMFDVTFAIDENAEGYTFKNDGFTTHAARKNFLNAIQANDAVPSAFYQDTQQVRCLKLLAEGKMMKEIACHLHISPRTVEHYLANLRKLIGAKNNKDLVAMYYSKIK